MKITSKETKTFYEIMVDIDDLSMILEAWAKSMRQYRTPKAFDWIIIDNIDFNKPLDISHLKYLWDRGNADTFQFIAEYFGFDGWYNTGVYYENHKAHKMTVFNYGDDFNV